MRKKKTEKKRSLTSFVFGLKISKYFGELGSNPRVKFFKKENYYWTEWDIFIFDNELLRQSFKFGLDRNLTLGM